ncbi:phospholipid methyltransferase-domain-containing protein [Syncephalis pseudoplumigaleata]|uniref:Phosphatidyl-N-methylethanolamine N-methyltransferase n=1 Tax=Syncephalis pseudoplumigaleata TaxID=1712513 RepID=A0A4P9YWF2_9FUNG|nr:phospholipid methyltransferase-domain-containing protein [Syncephalis pseudoplumigaleata]|eukprot:RKP23621.1 phospholipid methyltransferase-domain-containing protein [Syncephalis pseudoplumigaleata]
MLSESLLQWVDLNQPSLYWAVASIAFNPIFWTIAARSEYNHKAITKLAGGNRLYGCYLLAISIFSLGIVRDFIYKTALEHQPVHPLLAYGEVKLLGALLVLVGNVLVLSSMYALGVTGTYLGDYFGILMDERVTGFPFNVTDNPMYNGSTMVFLGTALWYGSLTGVLLTIHVLIAYTLVLKFEEPFTAKIYAEREESSKTK